VERVIRLKPLAGVNSSFSLESRREQGAKKKRAFIHRAALDNVFRHFLAVFVTAVGGGGGNTLRQHCSWPHGFPPLPNTTAVLRGRGVEQQCFFLIPVSCGITHQAGFLTFFLYMSAGSRKENSRQTKGEE
jgi:hypothetical protein